MTTVPGLSDPDKKGPGTISAVVAEAAKGPGAICAEEAEVRPAAATRDASLDPCRGAKRDYTFS